MTDRKAEIPVDRKLRDKLRVSKGKMTWDQYFEAYLILGKKLQKESMKFGDSS